MHSLHNNILFLRSSHDVTRDKNLAVYGNVDFLLRQKGYYLELNPNQSPYHQLHPSCRVPDAARSPRGVGIVDARRASKVSMTEYCPFTPINVSNFFLKPSRCTAEIPVPESWDLLRRGGSDLKNFSYAAKVLGVITPWYPRIMRSIKSFPTRLVCVYYCRTYYKAVRVGGGGYVVEDMRYEIRRAEACVD